MKSNEPVNTDLVNESKMDNNQKNWVQGGKYRVHAMKDNRLCIGDEAGAVNEIPRLAKQPTKSSYRSDWISDIARVNDLTVMATSMRGSLHYGFNTVRQDSYAIGSVVDLNGDEWLIAAISDGVSEAPRSHALADYMVRQTILLIEETLQNDKILFECHYWEKINSKLVELSVEYCKTAARKRLQQNQNIDIDSMDIFLLAQEYAATLEYVVIQSKKTLGSQSLKFVHTTIAGDGWTYILNKDKGWKVVKHGKKSNSDPDSSEVLALPLTPKSFLINFGELSIDDCLLMVTDGLGDIICSGNTPLGGFFLKMFPSNCNSIQTFLQVASVSLRQANDDRTAILIKQ